MVNRKTIMSVACGLVLTTGLIIILVLITMFLPFLFPPSIQNSIPIFIFVFSLLVVMPLISSRLKRLPDINKMIGWTLVGTGAELIALPVPLLFLVLTLPSTEGLFLGGIILTYSIVLGIPAGLISITAGLFLIRRSRSLIHTIPDQ